MFFYIHPNAARMEKTYPQTQLVSAYVKMHIPKRVWKYVKMHIPKRVWNISLFTYPNAFEFIFVHFYYFFAVQNQVRYFSKPEPIQNAV